MAVQHFLPNHVVDVFNSKPLPEVIMIQPLGPVNISGKTCPEIVGEDSQSSSRSYLEVESWKLDCVDIYVWPKMMDQLVDRLRLD